jgi:hypothetical protein
MATISHEPSAVVRRPSWIDARNLWASVAIVAMWLAVLFTAAFGPDIKTLGSDGSGATIPSAVAVAFFALFGTISVARHGFETTTKDD